MSASAGVMHQRVVRVNGTPVRNLAHCVEMVGRAIAAANALEQQQQEGTEDNEQGRGTAGRRRDGRAVNGASAAEAAEAADAGAATEAVSPGAGRGPPLEPRTLLLELSSRMVLVLPLLQAQEDTAAMLTEYEVRQPVSEDLRGAYERAVAGRGAVGEGAKEEGPVAGLLVAGAVAG